MPYSNNDFTRGGLPRRILPSFDFMPIVRPYVPTPTEEFGQTVQQLRTDYESARDYDDKLEQALASVRGLDDPGSQAILDELKTNARTRLDERLNKGDYENQLYNTKRDVSKFLGDIQPIMENRQAYEKYVSEIGGRNDIADKQRLIEFEKNRYNQSGGLQRDPRTGQLVNFFQGRQFVGDVNVPQVIDKAMEGTIKQLYPHKIKEIEQFGLLQFAKTERIPLDKIRQIAKTALENDPSVLPYLQQQQLLKGEDASDPNQVIENAITEYAIPKYGQTRTDVDYMNDPQNAFKLEALKQRGDVKSLGDIITSSRTEGVNLTPADYKSIEKQNRELKNQISQISDPETKAQYQAQIDWNDSYINSIKKQVNEQLTPEEREVFNEFNDLKGAVEYVVSGVDSQSGVFPTDEVKQYNDRYFNSKLKNKYSNNQILDILNKADRKVTEIVEATNVATDFTAFGGSEGTNENPHPIGATNRELTSSYKSTIGNYQVAFGDQQLSEKYITEKYKNKEGDIKLNDGRKVKGRDSSKDVVNITNGVDFKGRPILELTIRNEDGEKLGSELITSKDEGVISNVRDVAQRLIRDDDPIRVEQGYSVAGALEFLPSFWQIGAQTTGEKIWNRTIDGSSIVTEKVGDQYLLKFRGREKSFNSPTELTTFLAKLKYSTNE
jgi:hypothetical protein